MTIDWFDLPYDHAGRWEKKIDSIMNPGSKVTWPQFVAEMVIYFRTKILDDYRDVKIGPDWYKTRMKEVRNLNQQACIICNYFPHPDEEKLVYAAFKNFFRNAKPLKIGQFRKVRYTEKNGKKISNITDAEKDVISGISVELSRLIKQRDIFSQTKPAMQEVVAPEAVTFRQNTVVSKSKLASLLELENRLNKK